MKFCEAMVELQYNPKGYVVENTNELWCLVVCVDKDGKYRSPSLSNCTEGLKGYRLSLDGTMDGVERTFLKRDFNFFNKHFDMCQEFIRRVNDNKKRYYSRHEDVRKGFQKAYKRALITKEELNKLLEDYDAVVADIPSL